MNVHEWYCIDDALSELEEISLVWKPFEQFCTLFVTSKIHVDTPGHGFPENYLAFTA